MADAHHKLSAPAWLTRPDTQQILALLNVDGGTARAVGGCVRDSLLGVASADTEVDIATNLTPDEVMSRLEKSGIKALPTGLAHGTITAVMHGPSAARLFEITTLRADIRTDGRHAEVAFSQDWQADAARRDLTINALYCDADGTIYDPTDLGLADIQSQKIRFIGVASERIAEDYLRVLRFFRFHFQLAAERQINAEALAAVQAAGAHMAQLSGERLQSEMLKILALPAASAALESMAQCQLLAPIFGLETAYDLPRLQAMTKRSDDPLLRLMAVLPDWPSAQIVGQNLRLSGKLMARMKAAMTPSRYIAEDMEDITAALYFDGVACVRDQAHLALCDRHQQQAGVWQHALLAAQSFDRPAFPLNGAMMQAAGMQAGPEMGAMSKAVEAWWVAQGFPSADEVEAELKARLAQG